MKETLAGRKAKREAGMLALSRKYNDLQKQMQKITKESQEIANELVRMQGGLDEINSLLDELDPTPKGKKRTPNA